MLFLPLGLFLFKSLVPGCCVSPFPLMFGLLVFGLFFFPLSRGNPDSLKPGSSSLE